MTIQPEQGNLPATSREKARRRSVAVEIAGGLRTLGVTRLLPKLALFSLLAFAAGLAQAGFLVIVGECAVDLSQGHKALHVYGHSVGFGYALAGSGVLLVAFAMASAFAALVSSTVATESLRAARHRVVQGFFGADWSVQSGERLGHIQQLLGVNCNAIGGMIFAIASGLQSGLLLVALLGMAVIVSPVAALAVMVVGLLLSLLVRPLNTLSRSTSKRLAATSTSLGTLVTEYTRVAREFRLFGVERRAMSVMDGSIDAVARVYRRMVIIAQATPIVYQIGAFGFVLVALAAVSGHAEGSLSSFGAVLLLVLRSLTSASSLQGFNQQVQAAKGFLDEVLEDMTRYDEKWQGELPWETEPLKSFEVEFRSVSFTYDGYTKALQDVSFYLPEGLSVGIVGRSGSGKTTLSQILLGMRQPTEGQALIGGVGLAQIARSEGRSIFALVPQDPVLLQGSIAENISFFRDLSRHEIEAASRAAHLHEDVSQMPSGYETLVGEGGGTSLSGGQRQRVAIARALAGGPRILVLDEPTSALDARSEALVRRALVELRGKVTVVVISHRLATVDECDFLAVLRNGEIIDFGPREQVVVGQPFRSVTGPSVVNI